MREAHSIRHPAAIQAARPIEHAASMGPSGTNIKTINIVIRHEPAANSSFTYNSPITPRFQESIGPTAIAATRGIIIGRKVILKYGGPIETLLSPFEANSRNKGYRVPSRTIAQPMVRKRLLYNKALSLLTGANLKLFFIIGALMANSPSAPPIVTNKINRINNPLSGSVAKV